MSKKMVLMGLVGVLGVAALGTAASADQYRPQPGQTEVRERQVQGQAPTRPILEHRVNLPAPTQPAPPMMPASASGHWSWNGTRYVWVAEQPQLPPPRDYRAERAEHAAEAQREAEQKREDYRHEVEAKREAAQRAAEARREAQAKRDAELKREVEAKRAEQARRDHERHVAPDGTRVSFGQYHK